MNTNAVFVAKTRYDARDKMELGENFEAQISMSEYNRSMIDFWMEKYGYERSKSRKGYDFYRPVKQKLDIERIRGLETIAKELDAEKLRLSAVSKSVCDHYWMNTGLSVQGKSLMLCTKCRETKQTVC